MDIVQEPIVDQVSTPSSTSSNPTNPITDLRPEPQDPAPEPTAEPEKKPEEAIPKGVQKRIDRAVRQKYEAEARAKMLEERLDRLEQDSRVARPQHSAKDDSEPRIDNFDNFDEYIAAKAAWIADRKITETLSERDKRQKAERDATDRQKTVEGWNKRLTQATVEMPDFEDVLASSDVPMTQPMQQAIMESDIGPKLAYYLAKNPDEAEKIAEMSNISAIRALGRLEERLATQKPTTAPTNAPEPVKPVGTKAAVSKDPGKMSDAEYAKWRKQGRAA